MFGLLRTKSNDDFVAISDGMIAPYSRFSPDTARRAPAKGYSRFEVSHTRSFAAKRSAQCDVEDDAPEATTQDQSERLDDLHSDAPISIAVLRRALPQRFAEASRDRADAYA